MFDTELLRKLFEQRASQGAGGQQAPQIGAAGITPAQINPAQITPVNVGGGATGGPDPNQKVWGRTMGEMFPQLFQGQQAAAPRPEMPAAAPMANPNAPGMPQAVQPRIAPQLQTMSESPQSFSPGVSTGAVDSPIKPTAPAPSYMPPITGSDSSPIALGSNAALASVNTGAQDVQAPSMIRPSSPNDDRRNVMLPQLPGHAGDPYIGTDYDRARYDAVMAGRRDASGNISHQDANGKYIDNKPAGIGWKEGLKRTGIGFLQGAATNGIFGGLAGAAASAIQAKVSPDAARGANFDFGPGREILTRQQREYQTAQMEHQRRQAAIDEQAKLMGIQDTASKIQERGKPKFGATTRGTYNQGTGEIENMFPQPVTHDWKQTRTGEWFDANDPKNVDLLKQGAPPASAQQRLTNLTPGSVALNSDGQVVYQNPTTEKADPHYVAGVEGALKRHSELKDKATAADAEFQVARAAFEKNPNNPEIQKRYHPALANREAAIQALNSHAQSVNQSYGDQLEGGIGQGGFGYVKRKAGAKPAVSNGRANQSLVRNVNDLPKF